MSVDVQEVARARYLTGRAYERDFQLLSLLRPRCAETESSVVARPVT